MKFDIAAIFEQIVSFYLRLPLAQKIALPLLVAGSMAVIIFVARWGSRPDYALLYSGLEESDAAAVVEHLKDNKIGFRLREDGTRIEVTPPSMVHELRLELASAGLPKGSRVGLELFDESRLGMTGFAEKVLYLRGLQGELERTILSLDAVRSVRVHITAPEKSSFAKRDILPTASVLLRLKAGSELTGKQVKGIANLVAGSVERLTPENVTVMDSSGNLLNDINKGHDLQGADLTRLEYQREIEQAYSRRIESMLSEVLGPGRAVARVAVDLDFKKIEKEEESFDPAGVVKRSEREVEESSGASAQGGVPGVLSNLTSDPGLLTPPDDGKNSNTRKEAVRNYEVSRFVSRTQSAPGRIVKVSAAVLVDGQYKEIPAAAEGAEPTKQYEPLAPEMLAKIDKLVKQTIGFDSARGDEVTVENIRFLEPDAITQKALDEADTARKIDWAVSYVLPGLFIFLFFLWLVRPLAKFLVSPTEAEVDLSRLLPAGIEELEAELHAERSKLAAVPELKEPVVDIQELEAILQENSRICRENPQQAALLIRYWLNDGRI